MNRSIKCAAAITGCAVLMSASVMAAFADSESEFTTVKINKPYLNLLVQDEDGKALEGLPLKMVDKDGNTVAEWVSGDEKNAVVVEGITVLDGDTDVSELSADNYVPEISGGNMYNNDGKIEENADGSGYTLNLNEKYSYIYQPKLDIEGERMTLPANQCAIAVDPAYANRVERTGAYISYVDSLEDTCYFNDNAGKTLYFDAEAGKHDVMLSTRYSGTSGQIGSGGTGGWLYPVDHETTYIQMTVNIGELSNGYFNEDATWSKTVDGVDHTIDLKGTGTEGNYCHFYFLSGSVISAPIPDADGNVKVWISEEDPSFGLATSFHAEYSTGGGRNGAIIKSYKPDNETLKISTDFEIPENGLTLYDIPEGEYTIVADSEEYELESGSISLTSTKDLQSFVIVADEKTESSSPVSSESGESSYDDSSDIESSSSDDTSVESALTDTESSQTSSAAQTSSGSSSSKSADSNPATGAAAGGAVLAVLAAGLVTVKRKNK